MGSVRLPRTELGAGLDDAVDAEQQQVEPDDKVHGQKRHLWGQEHQNTEDDAKNVDDHVKHVERRARNQAHEGKVRKS